MQSAFFAVVGITLRTLRVEFQSMSSSVSIVLADSLRAHGETSRLKFQIISGVAQFIHTHKPKRSLHFPRDMAYR